MILTSIYLHFSLEQVWKLLHASTNQQNEKLNGHLNIQRIHSVRGWHRLTYLKTGTEVRQGLARQN